MEENENVNVTQEEPPVITPEAVRAEIKRTRHKAEHFCYVLSIVSGIFVVIYYMIKFFQDGGILENLGEMLADSNIPASSPAFYTIAVAILGIVSIAGGIGAVIFFVLVQLYAYYKMYANDMSYSIRVTEKNYPEIYEKVQEYTRLLGWKKAPEVYVQQMNGDINAYTSWVPGKVYVHLNAEIVDLLYLHGDLDTISFVMAHEFGHAYLHHVQIYYNVWTVFCAFIPFFGKKIISPLLGRAREFSADRVAQALTGGKAELRTMMFMAAGRHGYLRTDAEDYMLWINKNHNFLEKIARFITNLFADHPIMPFRTAAIMDKNKKSGRLI